MEKQFRSLKMLAQNNLEEYIKSLGVDLVGFSNLDIDYEKYYSRIKNRIESNTLYPRHISHVEYLNFNNLIDNPKLIISIGVSYHQEKQYPTNKYEASYSKIGYGQDYHSIIYPILEKIVLYIKQSKNNLNYYLSCDTKELDDRYLAYCCGLGFYGKNTMLINENYGSEVVYGSIICDLDIDLKDAILLESRCQDCNLCEIACPTKSLSEYCLNYNTCLSYLSQSKKMIDYSLMSNSIYGCDICNEVCPYNKGVKKASLFAKDIEKVDLIELISLSKKEYLNYYKDKGFSWLPANIIKKNAILLLKKHYLKQDELVIEELDKLKKKSNSDLILEAIEYLRKEEIDD